MNSGRADASTSTDDVKGRPLCLFYFTHPFGVLSPEPPLMSPVPPHLARAFDMEPGSMWSSSTSQGYDTTSTRPSFDLGNATVHRNPIQIVRNYGFDHRRESVSSSFFSSDVWFGSSSSSQKYDERRVIPYNRILPPLRLPSPRDLMLDLDSSDDVWPKKCFHPGKFSLPPIEMPVSSVTCSDDLFGEKVLVSESESVKRHKRVFGVKKHKRRNRVGSVRRMITRLMQRNVKGDRGRGASAALRDTLRLLRDAWPEPATLGDRCTRQVVSEESYDSCERKHTRAEMFSNSGAGGGASPGLLRRRYSMPETIMRKYRLAQQRSEAESEEGGRWSATGSGGRGACAWCGSRASVARREREHMRKSALLRLWGRAGASTARACPCAVCGPGPPAAPIGTRSLDASHSELRASPRRLRPDSSRERRADCPSPASLSYVDVSHTRKSTPRGTERTIRTLVDSPLLRVDDCSLSDLSEPFTASPPTMKEIELISSEPYARISTGDYIDGRISERSIIDDNDESNKPYVVPYMQPLTLETPSYDVLEIVVSETLEVRQTPAIKHEFPDRSPPRILKNQVDPQKKANNIPIDEYVSNILVESLNSLSDQLEYMNASFASDRKLSIVEKEIKVKLQNTGVNTIVHLSPTSNNQIIFGNEELYESDVKSGRCEDPRDTCSSNIREETISVEMNNNLTSAESLREHDNDSYHKQNKTEQFLNVPSDTVNKAVLQQIQKLFKDELQSLEPEMNSPDGPLPGISHIEISNVDVFIDNNGGTLQNADTIEMQTNRNFEVLGGVGSCNYYQEVDDTAVVPRFSAFPHTESMEVNTSSSEDAEILGSECTSLVDSLDDPNSPRSILLRRSFSNRRSELVRSAIDVLDLLPENMNQRNNMSPKEKSESFFIRIKDDDCDCEKENVVVADHMPETIKQRLYRRHRKRELRMECARRSKVKQLKRDLDSNHIESQKLKKEVERESVILINSLIDDVILKIAQDEYKCMYIKEKANRISMTKSDENLSKKQWKKDSENNNNRDKKNVKSNFSHSHSNDVDKTYQHNEKLLPDRVSLQAYTPSSPEDSPPMRIYQKSEIHEGNKCIEILEILEYVNSSQNSDTTNSDENHNLAVKNRKSRIPVPVNEKLQKVPKIKTQRSSKSNASSKTPNLLSDERNCKSSKLLANMLLSALGAASDASDADDGSPPAPATRRASVPSETRSRSNSLRFKNVFDIIPEEKSSLSIESTGEDSTYSRRASAPSFCEDLNSTDQDERRLRPAETHRYRALSKELRCADTRSTGTSPMPESNRQATQINVSAMTSPLRKSACTSPIRVATATSSSAGCQQPVAPTRPAQPPAAPRALRSRHEEGSNGRRQSISTQHEPTRRLRGGHSESDTSLSGFRLKRGKKNNRQERKGFNSIDSTRRSSEDVPSLGEQERRKERTKIKEMLGVERRRRSEAKVEAETERERRRRRDADEKQEGNLEEEWSSSESSGSLLCSLAPAWLTARRRRRRAAPSASGEWAVTVAGSCPSALPNDVEMRLRFPERRLGPPAPVAVAAAPALPECHIHPSQATMPPPSCHRVVECGAVCARAHGRSGVGGEDAGRLTVTVKKEASDSSIVASKSIKKSSDLLPDLHTYRASRSNTRSSLKIGTLQNVWKLPTVSMLFTWRRRLFQTQRGYSLHCWLPQEEPTPIRARNGLTVEGNAIVPRRKPRAPSMSERDLNRQASRSFLPTHLRNIF